MQATLKKVSVGGRASVLVCALLAATVALTTSAEESKVTACAPVGDPHEQLISLSRMLDPSGKLSKVISEFHPHHAAEPVKRSPTETGTDNASTAAPAAVLASSTTSTPAPVELANVTSQAEPAKEAAPKEAPKAGEPTAASAAPAANSTTVAPPSKPQATESSNVTVNVFLQVGPDGSADDLINNPDKAIASTSAQPEPAGNATSATTQPPAVSNSTASAAPQQAAESAPVASTTAASAAGPSEPVAAVAAAQPAPTASSTVQPPPAASSGNSSSPVVSLMRRRRSPVASPAASSPAAPAAAVSTTPGTAVAPASTTTTTTTTTTQKPSSTTTSTAAPSSTQKPSSTTSTSTTSTTTTTTTTTTPAPSSSTAASSPVASSTTTAAAPVASSSQPAAAVAAASASAAPAAPAASEVSPKTVVDLRWPTGASAGAPAQPVAGESAVAIEVKAMEPVPSTSSAAKAPAAPAAVTAPSTTSTTSTTTTTTKAPTTAASPSSSAAPAVVVVKPAQAASVAPPPAPAVAAAGPSEDLAGMLTEDMKEIARGKQTNSGCDDTERPLVILVQLTKRESIITQANNTNNNNDINITTTAAGTAETSGAPTLSPISLAMDNLNVIYDNDTTLTELQPTKAAAAAAAAAAAQPVSPIKPHSNSKIVDFVNSDRTEEQERENYAVCSLEPPADRASAQPAAIGRFNFWQPIDNRGVMHLTARLRYKQFEDEAMSKTHQLAKRESFRTPVERPPMDAVAGVRANISRHRLWLADSCADSGWRQSNSTKEKDQNNNLLAELSQVSPEAERGYVEVDAELVVARFNLTGANEVANRHLILSSPKGAPLGCCKILITESPPTGDSDTLPGLVSVVQPTREDLLPSRLIKGGEGGILGETTRKP